ncbi:hypothetical protein QQS21_010365 [Conoideocrella luteorostrata]|uniref:Uncharacterized protein n=1 Tax=Conoideocrella luteorostrata TaxID=1105319 RepID=A0AAJ0CF50_9HYPO|nr:hypothetical protein QQS21_010365 [Conoideocrella luteorostrata]
MRKALLTSSEVSALVSICVVILFTLALFLSGYTIQQRTLQDLRLAIRPGYTKPSPRAHLPGYFERETIKLQDGTIIVGESLADKDEKERLAKKYELHEKPQSKGKKNKAKKIDKELPVQGSDHKSEPVPDAKASKGREEASEEQLRILDSLKAQAAHQAWGVDHPDPLAKNPLPITRAERRKLIKEEIQKLAQGDIPTYHQRRRFLW